MAKKKIIALFGVFALLIILLVIFQYFQQDEWHSFGLIQTYGFRYITLGKPLWQLLLEDRAGARVVMYVIFTLFGASSFPFSLLSATIHCLNSYLVYLICKNVTNNKTISIIALLFFFFNSLGHQAYSWLGTFAGTATSVTFILLSLLFYYKFVETRSSKNLVLSAFFIFVSFLFKQSGFFVFILYPIMWFLYSKRKSFKIFLVQNSLIIIYGFLMTLSLARTIIFIPGDRIYYVTADSSGALNILQRLFLYPFQGIGQSFIPHYLIFDFSKIATQIFVSRLTLNSAAFDIFYTNQMAEIIVSVLSLLFVLLIVLVYKKILSRQKKSIRYFYISSFFFLVLSFLPYVVLQKGDAYLDSRYYYMGIVGASYLFSITSYFLYKNIAGVSKKRIVAGIFLSIILLHVFFLTRVLYNSALVSFERKSIISQIIKIHPNLNEKTVFYVTGNSPGYYGIEELKVPFQSGLGQVLMVVYGEDNNINPGLFKEDTFVETLYQGFLYGTLAQGYKEVDGFGFGYYYDRKLLKKDLAKKRFTEKNIIPLFYDSSSKKVERFKLSL